MRPSVLPCLVLVLALGSPAAADERGASSNPHLSDALRELRGLQEEAALRTLEKARTWPQNGPHDVALYHLYVGLAHAGLGRKADALRAFRTALIIEPLLALPAGFPPGVTGWYREAGGQVPEPAPDAALRPPGEGALPPAALTGAGAPPGEVRTSPEGLPTWRRRVAIGCAVAGTVALVAAVASGISASSSSEQARNATDVESATASQREARRWARSANVLYVSGAALGVGAGLLFVW